MASMSAKFDEEAHNDSLYRVHKLISTYVNCDLDLWPLTFKINWIHPLVIVNLSAKFDQDVHNSLVAIASQGSDVTHWLMVGWLVGCFED